MPSPWRNASGTHSRRMMVSTSVRLPAAQGLPMRDSGEGASTAPAPSPTENSPLRPMPATPTAASESSVGALASDAPQRERERRWSVRPSRSSIAYHGCACSTPSPTTRTTPGCRKRDNA